MVYVLIFSSCVCFCFNKESLSYSRAGIVLFFFCTSSIASAVPGIKWELRICFFCPEVWSPAAFTYAIHLFLATILQSLTILVSLEEGIEPKWGWFVQDGTISKWQNQDSILAYFLWCLSQDTTMIKHRLSLLSCCCGFHSFLSFSLHWLIIICSSITAVNFLPQLCSVLGCNCSSQNLSPHA